MSIPAWILIVTVPAAALAIFGYKWIHRIQQATVVRKPCHEVVRSGTLAESGARAWLDGRGYALAGEPRQTAPPMVKSLRIVDVPSKQGR